MLMLPPPSMAPATTSTTSSPRGPASAISDVPEALCRWKQSLLAVQPVLLRLTQGQCCSVEELDMFEAAVDALAEQSVALAACPQAMGGAERGAGGVPAGHGWSRAWRWRRARRPWAEQSVALAACPQAMHTLLQTDAETMAVHTTAAPNTDVAVVSRWCSWFICLHACMHASQQQSAITDARCH
jgi:hypothetical protein